jgi:hypothetical protein
MKNAAILIIIILLAFSCNKENNANGVIRDFGPIEVDGCGWVVQVGNETFHPVNLEAQYKVDNLEIVFDYKKLGSEFYCGLLPSPYPEIEILSID